MFCQCKEEGCILSNVRTNILNHHHLFDGNLRVDLNQIVELIYKAVTNTFQGLIIIQLVQKCFGLVSYIASTETT